jgi:Tol biopolymer transport system component
VASFSGLDNDLGPTLSADGTQLYFASDRPLAPDGGPGRRPLALWSLALSPDGRPSAPRPLPAPVNGEGDSFAPAVAADGTLYFASSRPGGKGSVDLYRALPADGGYAPVENLEAINSPAYEGQPAVAPDQRYLLFTGLGREDGQAGPGYPYPRADLYLSVRTASGFGPPRPVRALNTSASEASPSLSPDQRFLFFASDRGFATVPMRRRLTAAAFRAGVGSIQNGWSNLYRVPLEVLGLPPPEAPAR